MKPYSKQQNNKKASYMLSEKELKLLEELENNNEVVYLLNTEECEYVSRLITSYKVLRRQLVAMQIKEQEDWSEDFAKTKNNS
jgi:general stress protein 26